MDELKEEDKIEFINDLVPVKSKVNQTVLWKALNLLAKKGINDEEACTKTKLLYKEFPVLFARGYSCINKCNRRIISRMLGYTASLIVKFEQF